MAKKTEVKKTETVKVEKKAIKAKAPAAPVAPAAPAAPVAPKKAPARKAAPASAITPEERQKLVEQAAYYRAEKLGWQVDPQANWLAAEAEVDATLAGRKKA